MKRSINIDTQKWCTQKLYSELTGVAPSNISKMINSGKLKTKRIDYLGMTLVEKPVIKTPQ